MGRVGRREGGEVWSGAKVEEAVAVSPLLMADGNGSEPQLP